MPTRFVEKLKLNYSQHPASGPPQLSRRGCAYALNSVRALSLRYFTEFDSFRGVLRKSG